jgi:hypothetical protein
MRTVVSSLDGAQTTFGLCDKCDAMVQTYQMFQTWNGVVCISCK